MQWMFGITHSDLSKHSITYLMASVLKLMIMSRVHFAWLEIGEFHPFKTEKTEKTMTFKILLAMENSPKFVGLVFWCENVEVT